MSNVVKRVSTFAIVLILSALCIALRRPDQIRSPEVWNEDGQFVIPQIVQEGFGAVFAPVNGYLIVPSRLIAWISLNFPLEFYPVISTWIGVLAQAACVAAVAISPTMLRWPVLCAALMLVLPMNAEVYALPQYTFWWTTCLLFLALIWKPGRYQWARSMFVVIGGLSSPLVIALSPLFVIRAFLTRTLEDAVTVGLVVVIAAVQLYFVFVGDPVQTEQFQWNDIYPAISIFFAGWTVWLGGGFQQQFAYVVCAVLLLGTLTLPANQRLYYVATGLMLGASIASGILRVPVEIISPVGDGPRYFFLPLVLIAWMSVWLISASSLTAFRVLVVALIMCSAPVAYANFQRGQEQLEPWAQAVEKCRTLGGYEMPVHYIGTVSTQHHVPYPGIVCGSKLTVGYAQTPASPTPSNVLIGP